MKRPLEGNESGNNNKVPRMGNKGSKNENNKQENMSEEKMEVVATGEGKIVSLCIFDVMLIRKSSSSSLLIPYPHPSSCTLS